MLVQMHVNSKVLEAFWWEHGQKLTGSEEWTDGATDFLHVDRDPQKLKADQFSGGRMRSKMVMAC